MRRFGRFIAYPAFLAVSTGTRTTDAAVAPALLVFTPAAVSRRWCTSAADASPSTNGSASENAGPSPPVSELPIGSADHPVSDTPHAVSVTEHLLRLITACEALSKARSGARTSDGDAAAVAKVKICREQLESALQAIARVDPAAVSAELTASALPLALQTTAKAAQALDMASPHRACPEPWQRILSQWLAMCVRDVAQKDAALVIAAAWRLRLCGPDVVAPLVTHAVSQEAARALESPNDAADAIASIAWAARGAQSKAPPLTALLSRVQDGRGGAASVASMQRVLRALYRLRENKAHAAVVDAFSRRIAPHVHTLPPAQVAEAALLWAFLQPCNAQLMRSVLEVAPAAVGSFSSRELADLCQALTTASYRHGKKEPLQTEFAPLVRKTTVAVLRQVELLLKESHGHAADVKGKKNRRGPKGGVAPVDAQKILTCLRRFKVNSAVVMTALSTAV